jgi:Ca-activated chloride channel family protein
MKTSQLDEKTGEIELPEKEFGDLILPAFVKDASALHRVGFDLSVQMPEPIAEAGSPSHAINVKTPDPRRMEIRLAPGHDLPNRDLVLDVRMQSSFAGILCGTDRDRRAQFAAVVASDRFGEVAKGPRRIVFLFDRSGSMHGEPIRQAQNAVLACLGALSAADQVGFVAFDDEVESFQDSLADTDARTRDALRGFIEKVDARGGTELFQGLQAASRLLGRNGGDIFVLTDGQVSATEDIIQRAKALGIRVHCLGIGSASQDRFLGQLSRETGGVSRFVTPRERVDQSALELFAAIGRPVATDIQVSAQGRGDVSLAPEPAATVFSGHPLVVWGESAAGAGQLSIEWTREDKPQSIVLPINAGADADAETLKLLRGARLITDLESRLETDSERDAARKRESKRSERLLVELGRKYGLANRRLSLVAVVERAGDKAGQLPKTSIVPVGMPQDTEFTAYFGGQPAAAAAYKHASSSRVSACMCCVADYASAKEDISFSLNLKAREPKFDSTDLYLALARRIEPDGGLPGKTEDDRICHSLVVLLAMLDSDMAAAFRPHLDRLIAFLESGVCSALSRDLRELVGEIIEKARLQQPISGPWQKMAKALILEGSRQSPAAWREIRQAIATN